jgi:hypothetical protein
MVVVGTVAGGGTQGLESGGWNVRVEAFAPEYGLSADVADPEPGHDEPCEQAEPGELFVARSEVGPVPVAFVDGIRRAEMRLWAEHDATGARVPGCAGAYAVGAVTVRPGRAMSFGGIRFARLAIWGGGMTGSIESRRTNHRWASASLATTDPTEVEANLQDRMRWSEGRLAVEAADAGWNVVLDGPLNRLYSLHELVTGYVKSHRRMLLPSPAHAALPSLRVGERTRLYSLGSERWTCYLRVGSRPPGSTLLGGIARLEFPSNAGLAAVIDRADTLASLLPRYAGALHRDGRAPVNLTPVANLERHLRHTLGPVRYASRILRDVVVNSAA